MIDAANNGILEEIGRPVFKEDILQSHWDRKVTSIQKQNYTKSNEIAYSKQKSDFQCVSFTWK